MQLPIIVLGGGGHAKVVIDALLSQGRQIIGYSDLKPEGQPILGVSWLGCEPIIFEYLPEKVRLANGIGSVQPGSSRRSVYEKFVSQGFLFEQVIHPSAVMAADVQLGAGVQFMARAVLQPGACIGIDSVINTAAVVDHDCVIGRHVHIAPGAVLCGHVRIGDGAHIGAGAVIIQGRAIGAGSMVGAGAVVLDDVPPDVTVVGVPAEIIDGTTNRNRKETVP